MSAQLTHDRLRELLHYDPETGAFTWRVRRNQYAHAGDRAGRISPRNGYRYINIRHHLYLAHRLAFFYVRGKWPSHDIDHVNGRRDDNRWSNLRPVTRGENMQNLRAGHADNKTGLLGVAPVRNRFGAYIRANGRNKYLGSFDTPEEAHAAYLEAKRNLHPAGTL
jgi:hypothetical protein